MPQADGLQIGACITVSVALALLVVVAVLVLGGGAYGGDGRGGGHGRHSRDPSKMFGDTSDDRPGGLLAHMMGPDDLQAALASVPFSFGLTSPGITDCAAMNRKTCSAWTYLRRDLPPTLFIYPTSPTGSAGYWTPLCGVMLDPRVAWPMIASMSVVDSNSDTRSCCGNENGPPMLIRTSDNPAGLPCAPPAGGNWVLYLSSTAVGSCPVSCASHDIACRVVNSGGGINVWDLVNWPDPCDCFDWADPVPPTPADLEVLKAIGGEQIASYTFYTMKSCPLCAGPFLCSTQPLAGGANYASTPGGPRAYIGPAAERFAPLFYSSDWPTFSMGSLAVRQCKFTPDMWSLWVGSLKAFYAQVEASFTVGNTLPGGLSYLQGNPRNADYNENEVNIYVDPTKPDDKTFRDAILGFFWVSTTCTEQLAPLQGVPTESGGFTYTDVASRCRDFLCPWGTECANAAPDVAAQRTVLARDATRQMVAKFNATYRKGRAPVVAFRATPSSNSFFDRDTINKAAAGNVAFADIFTVDDGA